MYLTGAEATVATKTALARLQTFLATKLKQAPYAAMFNQYRGVGIANPDTPNTVVDQFFSLQPFLFLEIAGDLAESTKRIHEGTLYDATRHELEIVIEVVCSDQCRPAERVLVDALKTIIGTSYDQLCDLCLEETEIKAGMGRYPLPNRINPHTLSCAVLAVHTS